MCRHRKFGVMKSWEIGSVFVTSALMRKLKLGEVSLQLIRGRVRAQALLTPSFSSFRGGGGLEWISAPCSSPAGSLPSPTAATWPPSCSASGAELAVASARNPLGSREFCPSPGLCANISSEAFPDHSIQNRPLPTLPSDSQPPTCLIFLYCLYSHLSL